MKITTNWHKVPLLYFYQLTDKQQEFVKSEYDWDDNEDSLYFVYKDYVYHTANFMRLEDGDPFGRPWEYYSSDTYFSGIVISGVLTDEYGIIEDYEGNFVINVGSYYA